MAGSNPPPWTALASEQEGRKAGNRGVLGLLGVSRLRRVGHAVSVWGCIPLRSPARPDSWVVICCPCSPRIPTSSVCSDSTCASPNGGRGVVEFARVDIAGTELKPLLEGIDVVVHLAGVVDPVPDEGLMARVNVGGNAPCARRRRGGRGATHRAHLERNGVRRLAQQPGTAPRGCRPASEPALLSGGAGRRGGTAARRVAGRSSRRDDHHPAVGAGRGPRGRTAPGPGHPRASAAACSRRGDAGAGRARRRPRLGVGAGRHQRSPGSVQRRGRRLARRRRGARA